MLINDSIYTLDTPTLLLDLNKLEKNLDDIRTLTNKNNIQWRPHIKTHKSVQIAKMQLKYGATGITVAKLEEAEIMAKAGIKDILIAYPLSNKQKLIRLRQLARTAKLTVAIDSFEQAKLINEAFTNEATLDVWIKINSGLNRCGIEIEEVLQLATKISSLAHLHLTGLFTHAGHSYAAKSEAEIKAIAKAEAATILESANICEQAGLRITHRSIGSTPTFKFGATVNGITEIRPGNAAFYDMCQVGLGVATKTQCALTVLASVVSVKNDRIIFDAGSKALSLDQGAHGNQNVTGFGSLIGHPNLTLARLSEEHGIAPLSDKTKLFLCDKVQIIPNHACVVANLFDEYVVHRDGLVVTTWPVDARGKMK